MLQAAAELAYGRSRPTREQPAPAFFCWVCTPRMEPGLPEEAWRVGEARELYAGAQGLRQLVAGEVNGAQVDSHLLPVLAFATSSRECPTANPAPLVCFPITWWQLPELGGGLGRVACDDGDEGGLDAEALGGGGGEAGGEEVEEGGCPRAPVPAHAHALRRAREDPPPPQASSSPGPLGCWGLKGRCGTPELVGNHGEEAGAAVDVLAHDEDRRGGRAFDAGLPGLHDPRRPLLGLPRGQAQRHGAAG